MAKARIYGMKSLCVPNREADRRRRNNTFWKGREFAENDFQRDRNKQKQRVKKEKARNV